MMCLIRISGWILAALSAFNGLNAAESGDALQGTPWARHVIDDTGRGADGTKVADINGDGALDIVTGWEEDGSTRVYLNPGPAAAKGPWKKVVVGKTPSAEDALFVDLDSDGRMDVVTATEGNSQTVFVHWGPARERLLESEAWKQDVIPILAGKTRWMFSEAFQLDGRHGLDLVIGGRRGGEAKHSMLGWLEAPAKARDVAAWTWHPLLEAGWVMTIQIMDMDGDGDADILFSDRVERARGIHWLENPGAAAVTQGANWKKNTVGATTVYEVLFLGLGDVDGDGLVDIAAPVGLAKVDAKDSNRHAQIRWYRREDRTGDKWDERTFAVPANTGNVKSVAIGDVDRDGRNDFVVSCENAAGARVGVYWLRGDGQMTDGARLAAFDIAGAPGIKFDLVRLLDLDGDGDLDVLTNEEQEAKRGLGVVWYENPTVP